MKQWIVAIALVLSAIGLAPISGDTELVRIAYAANCVAKDNLKEKARSFISRCRKGSINREYPGELLDKTLDEIERGSSATEKKAWKLLNDQRFAK